MLKHFYAYNNETDRNVSSSNVPPRVRNEYDHAAFKPAIEADAATGVMASYNMVNGRPTHVDRGPRRGGRGLDREDPVQRHATPGRRTP